MLTCFHCLKESLISKSQFLQLIGNNNHNIQAYRRHFFALVQIEPSTKKKMEIERLIMNKKYNDGAIYGPLISDDSCHGMDTPSRFKAILPVQSAVVEFALFTVQKFCLTYSFFRGNRVCWLGRIFLFYHTIVRGIASPKNNGSLRYSFSSVV